MTTKEAIKQVLLSYPMDKRFTSAQLQAQISCLVGYLPSPSEVTSSCLQIIEKNELNLCHVFENKRWRYLRSTNSYVILKHNRHLHNDQMNKEIRKKTI